MTASIQDVSIDAIKRGICILDVASQYCELKKVGVNTYKAKVNPLRSERTSSLHFYKNEQRFHDFGTNDNGDVIDFVSKAENVTQAEARNKLSFLIGNIDTRPLHVKQPIKEKPLLTSEQIVNVFNSFELLSIDNEAHSKELFETVPRWLYDTANEEDKAYFHALAAYDKANHTLAMLWQNKDDEVVGLKRRRYRDGKWVNLKYTSPNQTAIVRIFDDAKPTYVLEGAHDGLVGILSGLNIVAIPTTSYSNINEFRAITEHCKEIVFMCEDAQGYQAMKRLRDGVGRGRLMSFGDLHIKIDLCDKMMDCQSVDEVLGSLIDAPDWTNEGDINTLSDSEIIPQNEANPLLKFKLTKDKREDYKMRKFAIEGLIPEGNHIVIIGGAGAGKTTITLHLCFEMAHNGYEIFYLYLDGSLAIASNVDEEIERQGLTEKYHILTDGTMADYETILKQFIASKKDLSKNVFVLDTLKFLSANINDKNANKTAMHLIKELTKLGATFISLAHTNKDGDKYSGTAEIEQDSDGLLRIDSLNNGFEIVSTIKRGGRCRFDVKEHSFSFQGADITSVKRCDIEIDVQKEAEKLEREKQDSFFIDEVRRTLRLNPHMLQKDLITVLSDCLGIGKNQIINKLNFYNDKHWTRDKAEGMASGFRYACKEKDFSYES